MARSEVDIDDSKTQIPRTSEDKSQSLRLPRQIRVKQHTNGGRPPQPARTTVIYGTCVRNQVEPSPHEMGIYQPGRGARLRGKRGLADI